jgi:hypothetical protein
LPEYGLSCSANAPVDNAFFVAHFRRSIASAKSSTDEAVAICHLALSYFVAARVRGSGK